MTRQADTIKYKTKLNKVDWKTEKRNHVTITKRSFVIEDCIVCGKLMHVLKSSCHLFILTCINHIECNIKMPCIEKNISDLYKQISMILLYFETKQ